ncbi:hypothetical protein GCM10009836_03190 [Pseudonocardia ailaonensis]|uniref:Uncharacterized protein n=1 Tax=Pseudonocardia ailaonensis TaxID=367279 RepID=A0ABN2MIR9_9PSEU
MLVNSGSERNMREAKHSVICIELRLTALIDDALSLHDALVADSHLRRYAQVQLVLAPEGADHPPTDAIRVTLPPGDHVGALGKVLIEWVSSRPSNTEVTVGTVGGSETAAATATVTRETENTDELVEWVVRNPGE